MSSRGDHLNTMIVEEKVSWKNGLFFAEGLWRKGRGESGAVICHPHPLMGGSMYNNVVETIRDVFTDCGCSTLRFNFRGVGASTGNYDEGKGEQQDILSACEYMKSRGVKKIILAGYSFGAWVASRLLKDRPSMIHSAIFVSPPQKYFDFDWRGLEDTVGFMVCGDSDPFCDADDLKKNAKYIHAQMKIFPQTDHFYAGREALLAKYLSEYIHEKKLDFNENGVKV
ncbi:MAG: Alpha/beta hydrolase family protein [Deltaproteobacteria bacterium ADurb.Bin151]|nr:MAG: Alpha/beta hydrolase family protein [Deltaproteobacteria bacterium ADurb.Bin151]